MKILLSILILVMGFEISAYAQDGIKWLALLYHNTLTATKS